MGERRTAGKPAVQTRIRYIQARLVTQIKGCMKEGNRLLFESEASTSFSGGGDKSG